MYYLLGLEKNLEAIAVISRSFLNENISKASFGGLKGAYFKFTKYIQPSIPTPPLTSEICFVGDSQLSAELTAFFLDENDDSKGKNISGCEFKQIHNKVVLERKLALVMNALNSCQKNSYEYYYLIQLLFSYVFFIQSESLACATSPGAPGLLLLDHKEWSVWDICEMFIHETAHQLVSLDEYRYGHYSDMSAMINPENYAISAIRRVNRPLNKVIHGLVVAFEILAYRKTLENFNLSIRIHPATDMLTTQIFESLNSINQVNRKRTILTPRASEICYLIENKMHTIV